jgi:uncharacterized protein (DUF427 family)
MTKQESVWDYPRPPRLERTTLRVRVEFAGLNIADSTHAYRVLETSHPPTIYIPPTDVVMDLLQPTSHHSFCEWKGAAAYFDVCAGGRLARNAAWTYKTPSPAFAAIRDFVSFYPGQMDACYLGDERVRAQAGDFYGGWITDNIAGPFKGGPGTRGW